MNKQKDNKKISAELVVCPDCQGNKVSEKGTKCKTCNGKGVFLRIGERGLYYWGEKLVGFSPIFRFFAHFIKKVFFVFIYILVVVFFLHGLYFVFLNNLDFFSLLKNNIQAAETEVLMMNFFMVIYKSIEHFIKAFFVLIEEKGNSPLIFWLSVFGIMYLYYYNKLKDVPQKKISLLSREFEVFYRQKVKGFKNPVDISKYTSPSSKNILCKTLDLSHSLGQAPSSYHLAKIVAKNHRIDILFKRLEIDSKKFIQDMDGFIKELPKNNYYNQEGILNGTILSPEIEKIIIKAFYETVFLRSSEVQVESLFLSLAEEENFKKYFKDINVEVEDIRNTIQWVNNWSLAKVRLNRPRKIKHSVMNKAWTARVTPELDQFSYDLTDHARSGLNGYVVSRKKELDNLMRILERTSKNNALLIGEEGSGRKTIVKELANKIIAGNVLSTLQDKRLVVLDIGALVAGARAGGDLELRIRKMIADMGKSGNIILFIPNIHNMAAAGSGEGFDASKVLSPILSQGLFQVIGTTDYRNYHRYIEPRADFANGFDLIKVEELSEEKTMEILAVQAKIIEAREGIVMTYGAIKKTVELSKKYITNRILPGKAIDLLSETAVEVRRSGSDLVLRDKDVMGIITEKTGIPLMDINSNEAEKLLNLEERMHQRVIGQGEAVKAISSAIRRVRVGMKQESKPIGTFLFLGPTGVGKTELAKALAEAYYGDESAMIRIDMSEYQTVGSVEKLIGSSSDLSELTSGGILTEAVKRKPFSLILLDELEKANKNVLNLFLQVFDDGRLTDNLGRTVDFTNTIIIATSNAGSKVISKIVVSEQENNERIFQMLEPYLLQDFTPEFLNRFTAKIVFRSLSEKDIMAIAKLQIGNLAKRMDKAQGIQVKISEGALKRIAEIGYSPEYGARFLQRTIQERIENLIATKFLKGEIERGDVFEIKENEI